jgi:hypothetical protein
MWRLLAVEQIGITYIRITPSDNVCTPSAVNRNMANEVAVHYMMRLFTA